MFWLKANPQKSATCFNPFRNHDLSFLERGVLETSCRLRRPLAVEKIISATSESCFLGGMKTIENLCFSMHFWPMWGDGLQDEAFDDRSDRVTLLWLLKGPTRLIITWPSQKQNGFGQGQHANAKLIIGGRFVPA